VSARWWQAQGLFALVPWSLARPGAGLDWPMERARSSLGVVWGWSRDGQA